MALYKSAGWVRNVYKLSKLFIVLPQRTLFAEKSLGITDYEDRRLRLQDYAIRKKKLVYEMKSLDINSLVRTTKQFVHCTKGSPEEIIMLKQSLRLIHENTEGKSAYNFGPIVMRMFHYFNLPNEALEFSYDVHICEIFDSFSCNLILLDLLFNNGKHEELVRKFNNIYERQAEKGMGASRLQTVLMFGACYKLNNPTYYNYAMKKWQSLEQHHQLTQSRNFVALLAINQNQPAEALKVLGDVDIHFSAVFVRLLALTKLERFEEIFNILNENFLQENQKYSKSKIPGELVREIQQSLSKHNTLKELTTYSNILNEILKNRTNKATFDEVVCWPISSNIQQYERSRSTNVN